MTQERELRSDLLRNEAREELYDAGVHAYLEALGGDDASERVSDALDAFLDAVLSHTALQKRVAHAATLADVREWIDTRGHQWEPVCTVIHELQELLDESEAGR